MGRKRLSTAHRSVSPTSNKRSRGRSYERRSSRSRSRSYSRSSKSSRSRSASRMDNRRGRDYYDDEEFAELREFAELDRQHPIGGTKKEQRESEYSGSEDERRKGSDDREKERDEEEEDYDVAPRQSDMNELMRVMGFKGFNTTKGRENSKVSHPGGKKITNYDRPYRQYMNRRGGFNMAKDANGGSPYGLKNGAAGYGFGPAPPTQPYYATPGHAVQNGANQTEALLRSLPDSALIAELERRGVDLHHAALEKVIKSNYKIVHEVGKGASGRVYKVDNKIEGGTFALKGVCFGRKDASKVRSGLRLTLHVPLFSVVEKNDRMNDEESMGIEIDCLKKMRHKNLVNLHELFETKQCLWLVMEYMQGGQIADLFAESDHFSERLAALAIKQVLAGVHYIHSMGVVHRDLKLENLLLSEKSQKAEVKIADFGLSYILGKKFEARDSMKLKNCTEIHEPFCGTPLCMAPEVARKRAQYGPQADMWSVGCVLYELLSGLEPFDAETEEELYSAIQDANPSFSDPEWREASGPAKDLTKKLLTADPVKRLSAREALEHEWLRGAASDEYLESAHASLRRRSLINGALS
ncbi:hypothetical protein FOL47_008415 [Perkinsus chesapeaki]|uniref:Protein kinase domain-containing protein n=1 Tax=Perkinsus chesapeaki TaxID=330153 RepID=A0A7J6LE53_PERCH|nr:hypothetical protein FOL47_008415 [Perkinsus chesapeaki]